MYQFICPKCEGQSFSASKLCKLNNPECPYCGSRLDWGNGCRPDHDKAIRVLTAEEKTSNKNEPTQR